MQRGAVSQGCLVGGFRAVQGLDIVCDRGDDNEDDLFAVQCHWARHEHKCCQRPTSALLQLLKSRPLSACWHE